MNKEKDMEHKSVLYVHFLINVFRISFFCFSSQQSHLVYLHKRLFSDSIFWNGYHHLKALYHRCQMSIYPYLGVLPLFSGQIVKIERNFFRTQKGSSSRASNAPFWCCNTFQRIQRFFFLLLP